MDRHGMHRQHPPPTPASLPDRAIWRRGRLAIALVLAAATVQAAGPGRRQHRFETRSLADFDAAFRCGHIDIRTDPGTVRLAPLETFRPSMAYAMERDRLAAGMEARIDVDLPGTVPGSSGGELLLYGSATGIVINGRPTPVSSQRDGGWVTATIPAGILRAGRNSIILPAGTTIGRDPQAQPARWSFTRTATDAPWIPAAGEYLVCLRVFRHAPAGELRSDVLDLLTADPVPAIAPLAQVERIRIATAGSTPRGTRIEVLARSGPTPRPGPDWSDWLPERSVPPHRFLQWRARLTTSRRDRSPILRAVRVDARIRSSGEPADRGLAIRQWDAPAVVRGSFPYTFQEPSARLDRLRHDWDLDAIVAPGTNQLDRFIRLRNWVRSQWPHNDAGARDRTWDAIDILTAPEGQKGMCSHFAVLFTQSALALGYVSRHVILKGHFVADIWSDDLRQWILMDVETVQPEGWTRYGTALYRDGAGGRPLDVLDLHRAVMAGTTDRIVQELAMRDADTPHVTHGRTYPAGAYANFRRFAYPPRNNYLDQLEPWEQAWGFNHYHSDAFLWWRNDAFGHTPAFTWQTDREHDIRWTVNTVALHLGMLAEPNRLEVWLDTVTPNFAAFRIRQDDGEWQTLTPPGPPPHERQLRWIWDLHAGENRLAVHARNRFDRDGAISTAVIHWDGPAGPSHF